MNPVIWTNPISKHPLNRGLSAWWLGVPHWRGGTTWRDLMGKLPVTLNNMDLGASWGSAQYRNWRGTSLDFDGVDAYGNHPYDTRLNWGTGDGTVLATVRFTHDENAEVTIVVYGAGGINRKRYLITMDSDGTNPRFDIDDNSTRYEVQHGSAVNDGEWHQLVGVKDGTNIRLYVDGVETAAGPTDVTGAGTIDDSAAKGLTIGATNNDTATGNGQWFTGEISDVRVWAGRALKQSDVRVAWDDFSRGYDRTLSRQRDFGQAAAASGFVPYPRSTMRGGMRGGGISC